MKKSTEELITEIEAAVEKGEANYKGLSKLGDLYHKQAKEKITSNGSNDEVQNLFDKATEAYSNSLSLLEASIHKK